VADERAGARAAHLRDAVAFARFLAWFDREAPRGQLTEIAAVEGSYASVLGGAPAAAVVFAGEVNKRTAADPRIAGLESRIADARSTGQEAEAARLTAELAVLRPEVRSQMLGQVADEFDTAHSIQRAQRVGSVDEIVAPTRLRPYLIDAVQRGMAR